MPSGNGMSAAIDSAADAVRSATEARRVVGERFGAGVANQFLTIQLTVTAPVQVANGRAGS